MADKFEDVAKATKNAQITFQVEDGAPISGSVVSIDEDKRTVTLLAGGKERVVQFPSEKAEKASE